jgi:hypothetical protein
MKIEIIKDSVDITLALRESVHPAQLDENLYKGRQPRSILRYMGLH